VDVAPLPQPGEFVCLGVDTSNLSHPEGETGVDRTLVPLATLPKHTHAVSSGWVVSHVVLLPLAGHGTSVLDTARVTSSEVAARQWHAVVAMVVACGLCPIMLGDRWSAGAPFLARMSDVEASELLRVTSNHVFPRPAPARVAGQKGASHTDGERFQCTEESSHGEPDATWEGGDAKGAKLEVRCWNHLHLRTARWIEIPLIQIIRHGASGNARDPKIRWCLWKREQAAPVAQISPTSRLRSSHEHGSRFDTQELLWDIPRLSMPERTER